MDYLYSNKKCKYSNSIFFLQASIVGYLSKKILFIGVRNRYCSVCAFHKGKETAAPEHACFINWNKSATSMEADIVVEGFKSSVEILGLKFNKLIGWYNF